MMRTTKFVLAAGILIGVSFLVALYIARGYLRDERINEYMTADYMSELQKALKRFQNVCGKFPVNLEALSGGADACDRFNPNEKTVRFTDSWGNPFSYSSDGSTYSLKSSGDSWIEATSELKPKTIVNPR